MVAPIPLVVFTPAIVLDAHAGMQSSAARMALSDGAYQDVLPQAETFESEGGLLAKKSESQDHQE